MIKILISAVLAIVLVSCNNNDKNKDKINDSIELSSISQTSCVFNINLDSVGYNEIRLSDFFKGVSYIPLETNDKALLGRINQFYMKGDTIFILDAAIAKSVVMYDKKGKYLGNVGEKGEGPSEYLEPTDFGIDNNDLYIIDYKRQRILFFSLPDLKYKSSMSLKYDMSGRSRYGCIENGHICTDIYYSSKIPAYLVHEIDTNSKIEKRWLSPLSYNRGYFSSTYFTGESFFSKTDVGVRYKHIASDSVMRIENGEMYAYLTFRYNERPSYNDIQNNSNNTLASLRSMGAVFNIKHYTEGEKFILLFFDRRNYLNNLIINKEEGVYRQGNFIHDLVSPVLDRKSVTPIPIWEDEKYVYFYIHTEDMGRFVKMVKEGEVILSNENKNVLLSLSEDSNPVLICYKK